jgi:natural product biosynthesis luciferase-like monooxygenase protein
MTVPENLGALSADEKRRLLGQLLQQKQAGESAAGAPASSAAAPLAPVAAAENPAAAPRPLCFSLMFFGGEDARAAEMYQLVIDCAKFADEHGLHAVWLPERHFIEFGCLYPSPAVLHAAIARETRRIRLRAGSVVMPLQNPIRVAEEWAVVDVLSQGRVDLSFASGWHPDDFALAPEKYQHRREEMFRGIEQVRRLWRGERIDATSGDGRPIQVRTFPTPRQAELNVWLTAAGNPDTFRQAGEQGAGVLTHLFDQRIDDLAEKIAVYRQARAAQGLDPAAGAVTVTLHTFIGETLDDVRRHAGRAYCSFLKDNIALLKTLAFSRGKQADFSQLPPEQLEEVVQAVFEKFLGGRSLLGTPETCLAMSRQLAGIGVNEIACLLDFGPSPAAIRSTLPHLHRLVQQSPAGAPA